MDFYWQVIAFEFLCYVACTLTTQSPVLLLEEEEQQQEQRKSYKNQPNSSGAVDH